MSIERCAGDDSDKILWESLPWGTATLRNLYLYHSNQDYIDSIPSFIINTLLLLRITNIYI